MTTIYFHCNTCGEVTPEPDMIRRAVWNPDLGMNENFLDCPCGEEEDLERAFPCKECGDFITDQDSDLCEPCWRKENPDTGDAEAAHKERHYAFDNLRNLD